MKTFENVRCGETIYFTKIDKEQTLKTGEISFKIFPIEVMSLSTKINKVYRTIDWGRLDPLGDYIDINVTGYKDTVYTLTVKKKDFGKNAIINLNRCNICSTDVGAIYCSLGKFREEILNRSK